MTSETDYPRQRTVAELLAEHGGGAPTGRRRRRRAVEEDEPDVAESPVATDFRVAEPDWPEAPAEPDRSVLREPVPDDPSVGVASSWDTPTTNGYPEPSDPPAPSAMPDLNSWSPLPPARAPRLDPPTEQIPLISDDLPDRDLGRAGPIERLQRASPKWRDALDAVGRTDRAPRDDPRSDVPRSDVPHGNGALPAERTELEDGGPPTRASAFDVDELDDWADADGEDADEQNWDELDDAERTRRVDASPAGDAEADLQPRRRLGRAAAESVSTGPAWALVVAQWIVGALGGAALWVGFRFLWRSLPVVAFTAAVLVTVGLILLVRSLLRSKDWRTTGLAVLVGLLLTVSPALLVLLDR